MEWWILILWIICIAVCIFLLWLAWWLGGLLGKSLTRGTGIMVGITAMIVGLFTVVGVLLGLLFGIAVIIKSKENEPQVFASTNSKNGSMETSQIRQMDKFIGKNYRDILNEAGLSEYCELFEKHRLTDFDTIRLLSSEELKEIRIDSIGDRKRILAAFSMNSGSNAGQDRNKHESNFSGFNI